VKRTVALLVVVAASAVAGYAVHAQLDGPTLPARSIGQSPQAAARACTARVQRERQDMRRSMLRTVRRVRGEIQRRLREGTYSASVRRALRMQLRALDDPVTMERALERIAPCPHGTTV
jgi:hypothetical protein